MQHFLALGFIKVSAWNLRKKQPLGWDRTNIYFEPDSESFTVIANIGKVELKFQCRYDQFRDAPTAYNFIRAMIRREMEKTIEDKLNEIL
nr:MAG TPA: hypothetical protein [Caudoviricetes sp.]